MPNYLPSTKDLLTRFSANECALIQRAITLVENLEDIESNRPRGLDVALNLLNLNVDLETILAAILSDSRLLDYPLEPEFGQVVASLVRNIKELNLLKIYSKNISTQASQIEILRRMLLSTADDIRALLIKLAYRLARLQKLAEEEQEMRHFIAQETLDLYAPIANRLGIGQLKWALEDYAFRYLEPVNYLFVAKELENKRTHREECIETFIEHLQKAVCASGMQAEIKGRPKHIYSIWQKMQRKNLPIDELYDLLAVRVIVQDAAQCYEVLGLVHQYWTFIPKEFDDYIANPKNNGYQSLHTVILDADNNRIEVQIRTKEMHDFAELGVAAHWRYKEGSKQDIATEKSIASLRQLLEEKDGDTLLANFRTELFADRVYVLTPRGQLIDLIKGATPLDFAYAIHTDVGHRCRGAKVNGDIASLSYQLQTGEQVEILTANDIAPNPNWVDPNLGYLKTPRAIQKVKAWLKLQGQDKHNTIGQQILEQEVLRSGIKKDYQTKLLQHFNLSDLDKLYVALGRSVINRRQLSHALLGAEGKKRKAKVKKTEQAQNHSLEIIVDGTDNILTHFAHCCHPKVDDELTGFISYTNGIAIHKKDCENISKLNDEQKKQLVAVSLKVNANL
ncbi:GTP diphosphokinase [Methylococcaceae bacterium HT4]|nr:bifunctional (p)ppGpp synthetase/guanosine-3',5'-bis(diphosphate) 3'-pyrophosphohydrolase [Methyloprofundus sp.]TXK94070.1 GTP diphosphokinase [Methylococcaceae bacterium CS4]TXK94716.1 GTP diphosphokinase [Methylococcaceae bacterium CS5]TXL03672.1 GTP diphosphokinase [Methylococcaceae bacterium CS1]TXL03700.1 GTP diphosphokinase [Methylococcaceae bacterium CS3]TXL07118.1 GTP diphosphokinase [Methylococcaceae bacterium CS2]TXL12921.1 GTP diphosphokinase [Methylococcaceae bacterium HT4]TXL